MIKLFMPGILLMCFAVAGLTGCSDFVSPLSGTPSPNQGITQNQDDDTANSDSTPYAIDQYLNQIRIAHNTQSGTASTQ